MSSVNDRTIRGARNGRNAIFAAAIVLGGSGVYLATVARASSVKALGVVGIVVASCCCLVTQTSYTKARRVYQATINEARKKEMWRKRYQLRTKLLNTQPAGYWDYVWSSKHGWVYAGSEEGIACYDPKGYEPTRVKFDTEDWYGMNEAYELTAK